MVYYSIQPIKWTISSPCFAPTCQPLPSTTPRTSTPSANVCRRTVLASVAPVHAAHKTVSPSHGRSGPPARPRAGRARAFARSLSGLSTVVVLRVILRRKLSRALTVAAPRPASCRSGRPGPARSRATRARRLARGMSKCPLRMVVRVLKRVSRCNRRRAIPAAVLCPALRRNGLRGAVARRRVAPPECSRARALSHQRIAEALAANRAPCRIRRATLSAVRRTASSTLGRLGARARSHVAAAPGRAHARFSPRRAAAHARPCKSLKLGHATLFAVRKTV